MKKLKPQFRIKNYLTILLLGFMSFFTIIPVFAAELFLNSPTRELGLDQQFQIDVFLDTENEELNALEGNLTFPNKLIDLKEIKDGNSIINFWIEKPALNSKSNILFSGIIPGGYKTAKGFIFSAVFTAKKEGEGQMTIEKARVLKNDGLGTQASLKVSDLSFSVSANPEIIPKEIIKIEDIEPPEKFKPEIAKSEDMYEGKYFLVFATQDKVSGVANYEVREGLWGKFVIAESPYLLPNQKLNKKIIIKAVDNAGNERVEVIYPPNWPPWYENYRIIGIIIPGIIFAYLIIKTLWRKFIK
jgi:hypothetical protein